MSGPIHYEVFARKTPASGWALQGAVENREAAIAMAEDMLAQSRAAAVMVTKEVFSESSGEFKSFTVLNKGAPEQRKKTARPSPPKIFAAALRNFIPLRRVRKSAVCLRIG